MATECTYLFQVFSGSFFFALGWKGVGGSADCPVLEFPMINLLCIGMGPFKTRSNYMMGERAS